MKKTMEKIVRVTAIYGVVLDRKTLINILSEDVEFAKHLLNDPEAELTHFIYSKLDDVNDPSLTWAWGEVMEGSEIYIIGREIMRMRDNETLGEFKKKTEDYISRLIKKDFTCALISIPEGVYWS